MQIFVFSTLLSLALGRHIHHAHKADSLERRQAPAVVYITKTIYNGNGAGAASTSVPSDIKASSPQISQPSSAAKPAQSPSSGQPAQGGTSLTSGSGSFQDGTIPCKSFPNVDGVVPLHQLNMGGWSGIQNNNANTNECTEGAYCSYACQPGMAKTQWPENQPTDGQTRGGLLCKGGMLYRTRQASSLCEPQKPGVQLVNNIGSVVTVCQTDYPGTENMVIPTVVDGTNSTAPLTCIDKANYFKYQGKFISSQFYVNPLNVGPSKGCTWGSAGSNIGNFSPLNFGAGFDSTRGEYCVSLFPNPNGDITKLGFNVQIKPSDGSAVTCSVVNSQYSGGQNGCTVCSPSPPSFVLF